MKSISMRAWHMKQVLGSTPDRHLRFASSASVSDQAIEAPRVAIGAELAGLSNHRLAGPKHKPTIRAFFEPLDHLVDAKAPLHLELAVGPVAGAIDA
jgi:hypothetical protein